MGWYIIPKYTAFQSVRLEFWILAWLNGLFIVPFLTFLVLFIFTDRRIAFFALVSNFICNCIQLGIAIVVEKRYDLASSSGA